jgi:hypothetical protein
MTLTTLGGFLILFGMHTLPYLCPVVCCLTFPSSLPPKPCFHTSSNTYQPTIAELIQHYLNFPMHSVLDCLQKTWNHYLLVRGSTLQLFHAVLSPDNRLILLLKIPSHPPFLPLFDSILVVRLKSSGKLLQGDFRLLQADWGSTFGPAQVHQSVTFIMHIISIIGNLR